jgi:adenine-specific DNA-methyltransferase
MTESIISTQDPLQLAKPETGVINVEEFEFEPIKGYPMLNWRGKRPFTSTQYYPAQLKEVHGEEAGGWRNKIFWGDNLQVMSHLLREFRGKVDLIYIDPPFDSKADYKKSITLKGKSADSDQWFFEEKQYTDIWSNDEYLQFMYERLVLLRELMHDESVICLHCDWHKGQYLRILLDEIFGPANFVNDIIWQRTGAHNDADRYGIVHDYIFAYSKATKHPFHPCFVEHSEEHLETRFNLTDADTNRRFFAGPITAPGDGPTRVFNGREISPPPGRHWSYSQDGIDRLTKEKRIYYSSNGIPYLKQYMDEYVSQGRRIQSIWTDILPSKTGSELVGYPTQKPEKLLQRIIESFSGRNALVMDCFMGSGTTQAVALKLGRRFIGADINSGAIQTTTKRLIVMANELRQKSLDGDATQYTGFEIYNVNHYDIFRNPVQAKELLIEALEVQKLDLNSVFDGEKDGRMVKIMPVNRITTRADLNELIAGFDYKVWERRQNESPNRPVEKIMLVCMGHEPTLRAELEYAIRPFKIDIEVVDILRDKADLEFRRDSQAKVTIRDGELLIESFYPMNLLQKLSLHKESLEDWRELVESVLIDWNYDGAVLQPAVVDIPHKEDVVKGTYRVPEDASTIRVKITDLLAESWEGSISNG